MTYHRSRPEGRHHRTTLRVLVVPKLALGRPVPTGKLLARLLRIAESEAARHMRRVLEEDGIATETRGLGRARRIYVVNMGYNGNGGEEWSRRRLKERSDEQDRQVPAVDRSAPDARRPGDDTPTVGQGASRGAALAGSRPSERRAAA